MENRIVKIYVLIDPITLKVRYIGRTTSELKKRLREHLSKARKNRDKNTHLGNWIRKLLRMNSKPFIRKITIIIGWKESHVFEKKLINKYKDRLLNHDDRGEGGINKIISQEQRENISKTLKLYYAENRNNLSYCKKIYVYNKDGSFFNEFPSIKQAGRELGMKSYTLIHKLLKGSRKNPSKYNYQFSYEKVNSMKNLLQEK